MASAVATKLFDLHMELNKFRIAMGEDGWSGFLLTKKGNVLAGKRTEFGPAVKRFKPIGPWVAVAERLRLEREFRNLMVDSSDTEWEEYKQMMQQFKNTQNHSTV